MIWMYFRGESVPEFVERIEASDEVREKYHFEMRFIPPITFVWAFKGRWHLWAPIVDEEMALIHFDVKPTCHERIEIHGGPTKMWFTLSIVLPWRFGRKENAE